MKATLKIMAVIALLGFAGSAFAQSSATLDAVPIGVKMIQPIALAYYPQTDGYLDFGTLVPGPVDGWRLATIQPNNMTGAYGPSDLHNLIQVNAAGDPIKPSQFRATGEPNYAFNVTVPTAHFVVDAYTGAWVNTFVWEQRGVVGGTTSIFDGTGMFDFNVGGSLNMNAMFPTGDLTQSYPVTVAY